MARMHSRSHLPSHCRLLAALHAIDGCGTGRSRRRRSGFTSALADVALAVARSDRMAGAMHAVLDRRPPLLCDRDALILAGVPVGLAAAGNYDATDAAMQHAGEAVGHPRGTTYADLARVVARVACAVGAGCDLRTAVMMAASAPVLEPLAVAAMTLALGDVQPPEPHQLRGEHEAVGGALAWLSNHHVGAVDHAYRGNALPLFRYLVVALTAAVLATDR